MCEPSSDLHLAQEPLGTDCSGEFGAEDFNRNLAVVLQVSSEIYRCHSASTQFPLDGVEVGQSVGKAVVGVVAEEVVTPFGRKCIMDGMLETPNGWAVKIRSVWMVRKSEIAPHFVAAYPR